MDIAFAGAQPIDCLKFFSELQDMIDEVDANGNTTIACLKFLSELQGIIGEVVADGISTMHQKDGDRGPLTKTRHAASFKTHLFLSLSVVTRLSRHNVVAPSLAAPLTDTRRSTVGSGTREDFATMPDEYMSHTI